MIINLTFGRKEVWLGFLFLLLIVDSVLKIIVGVIGMEKSTRFNIWDACDGVLVLVISVGWWLAE